MHEELTQAMSISRISPVQPSATSLSPAPQESAPSAGDAFRVALKGAASELASTQRRMDLAVRQGLRPGMEPLALIRLQTEVYRYSTELELASKVVDKTASAVKQTLQSQS